MILIKLKLGKQQREFLENLQELALSLGGEVISVSKTGAGHTAYTVRRNGMMRKIFCSGSPSDGQWAANALRTARKVMVAMA